MSENAVIVGANLAGGRAAEALRRFGYDGEIFLVGEEPWRPYERPPLSKEVLWNSGKTPENVYLNDEKFYSDNRIELCLSRRVTRLDLANCRVEFADGEDLSADKILLCTGARVRPLAIEGVRLDGVFYMRTFADSTALQARLNPGVQVVIVGMGVIGAEVAASARKRGCEVTAIEPLPVPMWRLLGN
jgi:3-phenylpropionate/trans-cinnamate dioxygenase ferredoxin reductase subunit